SIHAQHVRVDALPWLLDLVAVRERVGRRVDVGARAPIGMGLLTAAHQPGHMVTGQKHNRLNGHCPDLARCSLLPFACSQLCWRMEGDLIEQARVAGMVSARAGKNTE